MNTCRYPNAFVSGRRRMMRDAASSDILAVWKRAAPRNRMREIFTSGSVGGLAEQSLALPGRPVVYTQVDSFGGEFQQLWHKICAVILTEFNLPKLHEGANHVRRNCCGT